MWLWVSMNTTRALNLKQRNGIQPSTFLWLTVHILTRIRNKKQTNNKTDIHRSHLMVQLDTEKHCTSWTQHGNRTLQNRVFVDIATVYVFVCDVVTKTMKLFMQISREKQEVFTIHWESSPFRPCKIEAKPNQTWCLMYAKCAHALCRRGFKKNSHLDSWLNTLAEMKTNTKPQGLYFTTKVTRYKMLHLR